MACKINALAAYSAVLLAASPCSQPAAAQSLELPNCSLQLSPGLRQQCEAEFSRRLAASSETVSLAGGWRLVKTINASGAATKSVSIMHISDTSKSDVGLAGLT